MLDSRKELLDKIRLGEDSYLEYKDVRFSGERVSEPRRDSLAMSSPPSPTAAGAS